MFEFVLFLAGIAVALFVVSVIADRAEYGTCALIAFVVSGFALFLAAQQVLIQATIMPPDLDTTTRMSFREFSGYLVEARGGWAKVIASDALVGTGVIGVMMLLAMLLAFL